MMTFIISAIVTMIIVNVFMHADKIPAYKRWREKHIPARNWEYGNPGPEFYAWDRAWRDARDARLDNDFLFRADYYVRDFIRVLQYNVSFFLWLYAGRIFILLILIAILGFALYGAWTALTIHVIPNLPPVSK